MHRWNPNKYGPLTHFACCTLLLFATACGKRPRAVPAPLASVKIGYTEEGIASWYGEPYHTRAAASGEVYDMNRLTAAHKRLPFDTVVRVEHRATRQSVDVRITDRGPFVDGRIVDLSREAARRIGLIAPGTGKVKLRVVAKRPGGELFAVQAGVFSSLSRAEALRDQLEPRYGDVRIYAGPAGYRVVAGQGSRSQAEQTQARLTGDGFRDALVFRRSP